MSVQPDVGKQTLQPPILIGWRERARLPGWGIGPIIAKADTGARTGAIDVEWVRHEDDGTVRFAVALSRRDRTRLVEVEAPIERVSVVRSSFGDSHERIFVRTRLALAGVEKEIELGLLRRSGMLCRLLLGRDTLAPEFCVDPSAKRTGGHPISVSHKPGGEHS